MNFEQIMHLECNMIMLYVRAHTHTPDIVGLITFQSKDLQMRSLLAPLVQKFPVYLSQVGMSLCRIIFTHDEQKVLTIICIT